MTANKTQTPQVEEWKAPKALRKLLRGPEKKNPRVTPLIVIAGLAIGMGIWTILEVQLYLNVGISTPEKLFIRVDGPPRKGDFVAFTLDHPMLPHPEKVVKRIRCVPGEHLKVTDEAAWCDGEYLGPKKRFTLDGRPMPKFTYDGVIPEHRFFVMNPHKDSFDSRYYGLVDDKDKIRLKALF